MAIPDKKKSMAWSINNITVTSHLKMQNYLSIAEQVELWVLWPKGPGFDSHWQQKLFYMFFAESS